MPVCREIRPQNIKMVKYHIDGTTLGLKPHDYFCSHSVRIHCDILLNDTNTALNTSNRHEVLRDTIA